MSETPTTTTFGIPATCYRTENAQIPKSAGESAGKSAGKKRTAGGDCWEQCLFAAFPKKPASQHCSQQSPQQSLFPGTLPSTLPGTFGDLGVLSPVAGRWDSSTTSQKSITFTSNLYCSTPPICIAVLLMPLRSEGREMLPVLSHLYRSMPPICIAVRLPFVSQCFGKILVVVVTGMFPISCVCVLKTLRFKTLRFRGTKGKRPTRSGELRAKTQRM